MKTKNPTKILKLQCTYKAYGFLLNLETENNDDKILHNTVSFVYHIVNITSDNKRTLFYWILIYFIYLLYMFNSRFHWQITIEIDFLPLVIFKIKGLFMGEGGYEGFKPTPEISEKLI